jgi:hypothetical protein
LFAREFGMWEATYSQMIRPSASMAAAMRIHSDTRSFSRCTIRRVYRRRLTKAYARMRRIHSEIYVVLVSDWKTLLETG